MSKSVQSIQECFIIIIIIIIIIIMIKEYIGVMEHKSNHPN